MSGGRPVPVPAETGRGESRRGHYGDGDHGGAHNVDETPSHQPRDSPRIRVHDKPSQ